MSKMMKKGSRKQKAEDDVVVSPAAPVEELAPVAEETTTEGTEAVEGTEGAEKDTIQTLDERVKQLQATVSTLVKTLKLVESDLKNVRMLYQKEVKENNKRNKQKKPRKGGNAVAHGFVKEVKISDDLANFLKIEKGSLMARPKVTKAIAAYVRAHNLANPANKTNFKADKELKKLLGEARYPINKNKPELGIGYSYFNLQTHLVEHFIKNPPVAAAAPVVVA